MDERWKGKRLLFGVCVFVYAHASASEWSTYTNTPSKFIQVIFLQLFNSAEIWILIKTWYNQTFAITAAMRLNEIDNWSVSMYFSSWKLKLNRRCHIFVELTLLLADYGASWLKTGKKYWCGNDWRRGTKQREEKGKIREMKREPENGTIQMKASNTWNMKSLYMQDSIRNTKLCLNIYLKTFSRAWTVDF